MIGRVIERTKTAIGIAASCSSGLRANFGTMTKPFHAGNGAKSGVAAAIALLDKKATLEQFTDAKVLDPKAQDLLKKVTMTVNPEMEKDRYYRPVHIVKIRLKDGRE